MITRRSNFALKVTKAQKVQGAKEPLLSRREENIEGSSSTFVVRVLLQLLD